MNFNDFTKYKTIEEIADCFCVSKPTVSRWKSENKYPDFVDRIIFLNKLIDVLKDELSTVSSDKFILENKLRDIKSFFKELSK